MANVLEFYWDSSLIILSYLNAVLGAWIGLHLFRDARQYTSNFTHFISLIILAAFGFGVCGIWCMHYVGMLAYRFVNISVSYDILLVITSAAVAILLVSISFCYVAYNITSESISRRDLKYCYVTKPTKNHIMHCLVGGLIMGIGVTSMHYIGMTAVKINATQQWIPYIVVLSILIAIIVSFVGLLLLICIKGIYGQILASVIIGFAVCAMHYTGMYAVKYHESPSSELLQKEQMGLVLNGVIISLVSGSLVAIILILYHVFKFYQHRDKNFYKKRHGNIVIVVNIFSLLYIVFGALYVCLYDKYGYVVNYISVLLLSFSFYGFLSMLLLRYILSWYSINILWRNEEISWQKTLDADIETHAVFIHTNYGDPKWLAPRICIIYGVLVLVDFIVELFLYKHFERVSKAVWLTVTLCTLIAIVFIYKKTPSSVNDLLYIFWEMKFIICILFVMLILTTIVYFIFETWLSFEIYFIFQNIFGLTMMAIIPIEIILKHYRKMDEEMGVQMDIGLASYLKNMLNFQQFVKHLNREACIECLLFLVETTQWKQHFNALLYSPDSQHTHEVRSSSEDLPSTPLTADIYIELPPDIPPSKIVFTQDENGDYSDIVQQCKISAHLLYEKYIKVGAMYEINISYQMRNKINKQMSDRELWMKEDSINIDDLMDIFKQAMNEVFYLMKPAYYRFKQYLEATDFDEDLNTIRLDKIPEFTTKPIPF